MDFFAFTLTFAFHVGKFTKCDRSNELVGLLPTTHLVSVILQYPLSIVKNTMKYKNIALLSVITLQSYRSNFKYHMLAS